MSIAAEEHAIKWVIKNIDNLCDEFAKLPKTDDGKGVMHLLLSTSQIVDELHTSTIEHAKHEVLLLTRLHDSVSVLIECCQSVFPATDDLVTRLKSVRRELQQLFTQSGIQFGIRKETKLKIPKAVEFAIDRGSIKKKPKAWKLTSSGTGTTAEKTKTPSDEVDRVGHADERSDRFDELTEGSLQNVQHLMEKKTISAKSDEKSTSEDTKATITHQSDEEPSERTGPVESSSDVKMLVAGATSKPVKILIPPSQPNLTKSDNPDATRTTSMVGDGASEDRTRRVFVEEEPTIAQMEIQNPAVPHQAWILPSPIPVQSSAELVECSASLEDQSKLETASDTPSVATGTFGRNVVYALVFALVIPFVLIWSMLSLDRSMLTSQIACAVANAFCEHYDQFCTDYCVSGFQREKWHRACS